MVDILKHVHYQFLWLLCPLWSVSSTGRYETGRASGERVTSFTKTITSKTGSDVRLVCPARKDSVEWRKNGRRLNVKEGVISITGKVLVIRDVSQHDSGHYRCGRGYRFFLDIVSKKEKEASSPQIKPGSLVHTTVDEGSTVNMECKVKSRYLYSLRWYRGKHDSLKPKALIQERQKAKKKSQKSALPEGDKLTLDDVTVADRGWYTCVAKSRAGLAQESAWLEVIPAPTTKPHRTTHSNASAPTVLDAEWGTAWLQTDEDVDEDVNTGRALTGVYLKGMVYAVALSAVVLIIGLASFMAVGIYKARRRQDVVLQPCSLK